MIAVDTSIPSQANSNAAVELIEHKTQTDIRPSVSHVSFLRIQYLGVSLEGNIKGTPLHAMAFPTGKGNIKLF